MRKSMHLLLLTFLFITCQKEQLRNDDIQRDEQNLPNLKSADDAFLFLNNNMPDVYTPAEISRIRQMIGEPKTGDFKRSGKTVELPSGSVDALQSAVDEAGPGGMVVVKSGEHTENGLVNVEYPLKLIGENGATILINTPPFTGQIAGGIWFNHANNSQIRNITFSAGGVLAPTALLIQNSDRVVISDNMFTKFLISIMVQHSDHITIRKNHITADNSWQTGGPNAVGIMHVNGKSASIYSNTANNAVFGIWCCDRGGVSYGNNTAGNLYGQIICKVPADLMDPDGEIIGADDSGNHWLIALNESSNNLYAGIVVIDGSNNNVLLANSGSGNMVYDIDLVGPTERFGFFTPTSYKNRVYSYNDQTIKDCGEDNKVIGGTLIDTGMYPCDNVEVQ
ncbi:MAG: right-handed parallel beta-helix repeat-containing protein [Saprospiraceae bacterium]|nr:right-handed parallel beta-helix repeat-containing protein [Saprospiraceae bacterium]